MSRDLNEMLETTPSTDELMDVDTSFLDAYRRGGRQALKRVQAREGQQLPQQQLADVPAIERTQPAADPRDLSETDSRSEVETPARGPDDDLDPGRDVEPESDHAPGDGTRAGHRVQRGGRGTGATGSDGAAASGEMIPGSPAEGAAVDAAPQAQQEDGEDVADAAQDKEIVTAPMVPHAASGENTPALLQLTDHQEAVQNSAASTKTGSSGSDDGVALPQSGFRLAGVKSQPAVRALPEVVVNRLREELRSAAVRELGVSDAAAREFSQRLSQVSLVTAFLLAQLDLRLEADAATRRAAELFRSRDPLLGSMASRLEGLQSLETEKRGMLNALREELAEVRQMTAVVEQALAYVIADRTQNFLRGSHDIHMAPITHTDALFVRDRAREATRKQAKHERERDGRPVS